MGVVRNRKQVNVTLPHQTLNEIDKLINDMNLIGCSNRSVTIAIAVHEYYCNKHAATLPQELRTE